MTPGMIDPSATIHPFAHVDGAVIGARTRVWQFASVIRRATIGVECVVGSASIIDGATVGDRCLIGHAAQLHPGARLGDEVFIGPGVICCNDRWPMVDKGGFDFTWLVCGGETVSIGDRASIGAGAVLLPGVVIEEGAMIAARAVVNRRVPAHHLFKRNGEIVSIDRARRMRIVPSYAVHRDGPMGRQSPFGKLLAVLRRVVGGKALSGISTQPH